MSFDCINGLSYPPFPSFFLKVYSFATSKNINICHKLQTEDRVVMNNPKSDLKTEKPNSTI